MNSSIDLFTVFACFGSHSSRLALVIRPGTYLGRKTPSLFFYGGPAKTRALPPYTKIAQPFKEKSMSDLVVYPQGDSNPCRIRERDVS